MGNNQTIYFGGGCFWCVEAVVQRLKGVVSVKSGYAGGNIEKPSYEQVSSGTTGHIEVVQVEFDPSIIKLDDLLSVFFSSHDPTSLDRQGEDAGEQYRSAIFYTSDEQKTAVEQFIKNLESDKTYDKPIVTQIKPAGKFYEAEGYHQNYYNNNQNKSYCQLVINPKVTKLRQKYSHLLK
jgi:peptide-methionine (S)-S-oxide reductase